jgi:hypothetical protein
LPCHFYLVATQRDGQVSLQLDPTTQFYWLILGLAGGCTLGIAATAIPMVIGLRAFRRLEA